MRRVSIILLLLALGVIAAYFLNERDVRGSDAQRDPAERRSANTSGPSTPAQPVPAMPNVVDAGVADPPDEAFPFDLGDLDFDALREKTPDSLYWLMAAPTDDPEALEARARARDVRNRQYGRVVSNTATVEEIHDYYAYRRRLSEDYIEVLQLILDEHGGELAERDASLFELTIAMHTARLAEIPAKLDDALQRKNEYDRAKDAWKRDRAEADPRSP